MAALSVRNIPEDIHRALKLRAAAHGRSAEGEVRAILAAVLKPEPRVKLGDALAAIGRRHALTDEDVDYMNAQRVRFEPKPIGFDE